MSEPQAVPSAEQDEVETVTATLRVHPRVRAARVEHAKGGPGESGRLVAHVVPVADPGGGPAGDADPVVDSWRAVFDDCYEVAALDTTPQTSRITGWTDSITGRPVSVAQMAEWVDTTVARISALGPRRILEIGAGTGLLMDPLVRTLGPDVYTATDFSEQAVLLLRELAAELKEHAPGTATTVAQGPAVAHVEGGPYDLVIINSVAQYFPSILYLEEVLRRVLPAVAPGGHVFLGDLRHAGLRDALVGLKHHRQAPAGADHAQLTAQMDRELRLDGELSLHPGYLHSLVERIDGITGTETAPRRGASPTEMTLFRYDAVVHVGCPSADAEPEWCDGGTLTVEQLRIRLAGEEQPFGFRGVPNARLAEALALREPSGAARDTGPAETGGTGHQGGGDPTGERGTVSGLDPERLCLLAEESGWSARLRWTPDDDGAGRFDLWCVPSGHTPAAVCQAVPGVAGAGRPWRQPVFPPRVELSCREEVLRTVNADLPPGLRLQDLVFVPELS
ncbi:methyltransferase [Streptomyces sp. MB09-01]|uniref:class I SAM-dependent methyltransferase n=1 Tax=Streptomyces sp. MB09-01 TaxID=3028666 RepID=UPI0029B1724D|nr:methyltransferase [Streptomyces sp. MB09-01]MDX3536039.1 methyltransferase [Streptomyces sp. MB09-01]